MSENGKKGIKLVHASLYRMGTMSMSEAYSILGLNPHHYHALSDSESDWKAFDRAVDGKWPHVPGAQPGRGKFTRADWEAVRLKGGNGEGWDFFTDFFAHFTPDIIRAYPEAKVIVVQRDFDSWWPSYTDRCTDSVVKPSIRALNWVLHLFQRVTPIDSVSKQYLGFFGVSSLWDIDRESGRKAYDAFFQEIRDLVPPERRLEYKLSDGWEPLCKFLDKPIPDVPFPRVNTTEQHRKKNGAVVQRMWAAIGAVAVGVVAVGWGAWYFASR